MGLNNLKVSLKLGLLIGIALLALCLIGGGGYYHLRQAGEKMNVMYEERLVPIRLSAEVASWVREINNAVLELMLTTDDAKNQELLKVVTDRMEKINNNIALIEKTHLDTEALKLLAKVKSSQGEYRSARTQVIDLAMQNKNQEAYVLYCAEVAPLTTSYIGNLRDFAVYYTQLSEKMNGDNRLAMADAGKMIALIFGCAVLILIGAGYVITRAITQPLQLMVAFCAELANGDFREKPRKLVRTDEIGQLAESLAQMRSSLRTVLKQVNESAQLVAASSQQLTASAEQSSHAVTQVAGAISDVAQSAEQQLTVADETAALVLQIANGIRQSAEGSNQVAQNSAQAADKAQDGNAAIAQAVKQMLCIEETVNHSAQVVATLGDRSKEIGQIVDAIAGIAGQTNLLALNAAIEAARAGEQGRGFAVVAEEVRKLAEQSQEAAKQIAALIGEIQGDTEKAVAAMGSGTHEVKIGTAVVATAGKAFEEITGLVENVSGEIRGISAVMQQIAGGSQQVVNSVEEIDELSKKSVGEAQTVSAATEEQAAAMEEIAASSHNLAKLAEELQAAVNRFQI